MANKNKVEFGLSNVHVAIEKGDGWDVPKHIPGAVTFTPSAESDDFHFYADDGDYYNESTDNGYSGELSMALLPDWFLGAVLGYKKLEDGGIVEIKNAPKKRFFSQDGLKNFSVASYSCHLPTPELCLDKKWQLVLV